MKVAYLQCFCGVSEQMILGALIDAGISMQELKKELVELHIKFEFKIEGSRVEIISEEIDKIRNLDYARLVIEKSSLKKDVIQNITKIFDKIAHLKSEVKINTLSLLYSCAIVIGFKLIGAHKIYISPINVGQGLKESQLGFIPVPEVATLELLKGLIIYSENLKHESITPIGAAIVSSICESCKGMPEIKIEYTACGLGKQRENNQDMLRLIVGEDDIINTKDYSKSPFKSGQGIKIETNIDDMNPQFYEYLSEKLREAGGRDVFIHPIYMKKSRPGNILCVTGLADALETIIDVIFKETTSIGLKVFNFDKYMLSYEIKIIETELGSFNVKLAQMGNYIANISPEYEECRQKAKEYSIPIKYVYDLVKAEALKTIDKDNISKGGNIYGH